MGIFNKKSKLKKCSSFFLLLVPPPWDPSITAIGRTPPTTDTCHSTQPPTSLRLPRIRMSASLLVDSSSSLLILTTPRPSTDASSPSCALVPPDSVRSTPPSGTQRPKRDTMPGLSSEPNAPSTPSASDGQTSRRPATTSSENVTIEHAFSDSTTVYMQVNLNKQYVKAYIKKQK